MSLQCPLPESINPLSPNGFMFSVEKLPSLTYFCQSISIPDITLDSSRQSTNLSDILLPGDKINFDMLSVRFLVDEQMSNYTAINDWITALGFPENSEQYSEFIKNQTRPLSEVAKGFSDGVLTILGSNFAPVKTFKFVDLHPVSLGTLEFSTTNTGVQYLTGQATFAYSYYTIE